MVTSGQGLSQQTSFSSATASVASVCEIVCVRLVAASSGCKSSENLIVTISIFFSGYKWSTSIELYQQIKQLSVPTLDIVQF